MPVREITVEVYAPTEAELDAIESAASSAVSPLAKDVLEAAAADEEPRLSRRPPTCVPASGRN